MNWIKKISSTHEDRVLYQFNRMVESSNAKTIEGPDLKDTTDAYGNLRQAWFATIQYPTGKISEFKYDLFEGPYWKKI